MKIVITGGPHSGKTTLIEHLRKLGFQTIPEASKIVIHELGNQHGNEWVKQLRLNNPSEFQRRILDAQEKLEEDAPKAGIVFFDRGVIDSLAYYHFSKLPIPEKLTRMIGQYRYDKVFMLDMILPYTFHTGRITNPKSSQQIRMELDKAYHESGYDFIIIPQMPVEERADIVLNELKIKKNH